MSYLLDRERALLGRAIVAVIGVRGRGVRSHVLLADHSVYRTLTRSRTIAEHLTQSPRLREPWAAFSAPARRVQGEGA